MDCMTKTKTTTRFFCFILGWNDAQCKHFVCRFKNFIKLVSLTQLSNSTLITNQDKFESNLLPNEDFVILYLAEQIFLNYLSGYIRIPYQVICPRKISSYLGASSSGFIPSPRWFVYPLKTIFIADWANPICNHPRNEKIKNRTY